MTVTNDQITLVEIRERLVRIETILEEQDYKSVQKTADEALALARKNEKSVLSLQSIVKWTVGLVMAAVVGAILKMIIVQ
jgi:hypothetical protein